MAPFSSKTLKPSWVQLASCTSKYQSTPSPLHYCEALTEVIWKRLSLMLPIRTQSFSNTKNSNSAESHSILTLLLSKESRFYFNLLDIKN